MGDRPVVFVVLVHEQYVRSYLRTGSLRELLTMADVRIAALAGLSAHEEIAREPGFCGTFSLSTQSLSRQRQLFDVLMWRHRRRAKAFRFRSYRTFGAPAWRDLRRASGWRERRQALRRIARRVPRMLRIIFLGSRLVAPIATRLLTRSIPPSAQLRDLFAAVEPDAVLVPNNGYKAAANDVVRVARANGVPSAFLIDNWDNLSSKSLMWVRPDRLAVWGPQSVRHAVDIHGFRANEVAAIGTPRFADYYTDVGVGDPPIDGRYVVFAGCALAFDETRVLHRIDDEIANNPDRYGNLTVIYRPHPWRQRRRGETPFRNADFRRVRLDPQYTKVPRSRDRILPELDHSTRLLKNAVAVVAPLTTMIIEAVLCRRPVLVLAYDDGVHWTSPSQALANYDHFDGIEAWTSLTFARSLDEVPARFRDLLATDQLLDPAVVTEETKDVLFADDRPYSRRLAEFTHELLQGADAR